METLHRFFVGLKYWASRPRNKKLMYAICVLLVALWVAYRFFAIGVERRLDVYNPARAAAEIGIPVNAIEIQRTLGVLREPISVKNNRAYVSGARASLLRAGMRVGDGEIVSVAGGIDLDTGMRVVRTRGVADGLHSAEFRANGYFVPVSAIDNGAVYVARDGIAVRTPVVVARQDMDTAYITSGLNDGDIVILSRVSDGSKVNVKQ